MFKEILLKEELSFFTEILEKPTNRFQYWALGVCAFLHWGMILPELTKKQPPSWSARPLTRELTSLTPPILTTARDCTTPGRVNPFYPVFWKMDTGIRLCYLPNSPAGELKIRRIWNVIWNTSWNVLIPIALTFIWCTALTRHTGRKWKN